MSLSRSLEKNLIFGKAVIRRGRPVIRIEKLILDVIATRKKNRL